MYTAAGGVGVGVGFGGGGGGVSDNGGGVGGGGGNSAFGGAYRGGPAVKERGGIRKKYEELAEMQQLASVLIEEHLGSQEARKRNQVKKMSMYTLKYNEVIHCANFPSCFKK
jgi:hypothetical protein